MSSKKWIKLKCRGNLVIPSRELFLTVTLLEKEFCTFHGKTIDMERELIERLAKSMRSKNPFVPRHYQPFCENPIFPENTAPKCSSKQTQSSHDKKFKAKKVNLFFNKWLKIFLYFYYCFFLLCMMI